MVPGANKVVGRCLARRVPAGGLLGMGLRERRIFFGERAVDLVGADMHEAEGDFVGFGQTAPVGPHGFEQPEGANKAGATCNKYHLFFPKIYKLKARKQEA